LVSKQGPNHLSVFLASRTEKAAEERVRVEAAEEGELLLLLLQRSTPLPDIQTSLCFPQ
jgi:predicted O-methyltransferase YrrM